MGDPGNPPEQDGRKQRWTQHRVARRQELIDATIAAVRERGAAIGMDDVAAVSGIAKQVFYRYFSDKADLFLAVGRDVAERIASDVLAAVDGASSPRAMVAAGVEAFLKDVESDPELYRFVLQRPLTAAAVNDYTEVVGMHVSRVIGDALRAAGQDSGVAEPWGFAMVGAVRSAAERWLEQRTMSREALAGYLTDLLWAGGRSAYRAAAAPPIVPRSLPPTSEQG